MAKARAGGNNQRLTNERPVYNPPQEKWFLLIRTHFIINPLFYPYKPDLSRELKSLKEKYK
jgi:hypothetical protein